MAYEASADVTSDAVGTHTAPPVYSADGISAELRQGEVISNLKQWLYDGTDVKAVTHPYCVVATQDCDLQWDYAKLQKDDYGDLNSVLIFEAEEFETAKAKLAPGREVKKRVQLNKDERYHFLSAVPGELDSQKQGLPELAVDFKRFFSLPSIEIYRQCGLPDGARRRMRLEVPFREHFSNRVAIYLQRIALPE